MSCILVVDDSWLQRQLINNILKNHGYETIEANDGKDAVQKALEYKPDCIVLDLLMPGIDGLKVLEILKEKQLEIPVIILSADIQNTTRTQCFELGVIDFINKPAQAEALLAAMEKALN